MFYTRQALLKAIPCLSHENTYLKQSHVLHMAVFVPLSQDLHDLLASYLVSSYEALHRYTLITLCCSALGYIV